MSTDISILTTQTHTDRSDIEVVIHIYQYT